MSTAIDRHDLQRLIADEQAQLVEVLPAAEYEDEHGEPWTIKKAVIALAIAGVAVGVMSEILVGSISEAAASIGLSEFFVGVIVVAIVGNAAEHWVAVLVAVKNKMDLAVNIAVGSSICGSDSTSSIR